MLAVRTHRDALGGRRRNLPHGSALMAAVRSAGELSLTTLDPIRKTAAAKLALAGRLAIDEIGSDGRLRRLTPADVLMASARYDWRVTLAWRGF